MHIDIVAIQQLCVCCIVTSLSNKLGISWKKREFLAQLSYHSVPSEIERDITFDPRGQWRSLMYDVSCLNMLSLGTVLYRSHLRCHFRLNWLWIGNTFCMVLQFGGHTCCVPLWSTFQPHGSVGRYSPDYDIRLVSEGGCQVVGDIGRNVDSRPADGQRVATSECYHGTQLQGTARQLTFSHHM